MDLQCACFLCRDQAVETQEHVTNHRLLGIFVIRVPTNAHHHFVDISVTNAGPAIVDAGADISWKIVHYRVRKVGWI